MDLDSYDKVHAFFNLPTVGHAAANYSHPAGGNAAFAPGPRIRTTDA